jgi:hypothetical protein
VSDAEVAPHVFGGAVFSTGYGTLDDTDEPVVVLYCTLPTDEPSEEFGMAITVADAFELAAMLTEAASHQSGAVPPPAWGLPMGLS